MVEVKLISEKNNASLYNQVLHIRNDILRKPLGLNIFDEDLSQESYHITLAAITTTNDSESEEKALGCVILVPCLEDSNASSSFKVRQMAVATEHQGLGIGTKLIENAEKFAISQGKSRIYLHARDHAVGFYRKFGYQVVSEQFLEIGIPHFAMEKVLS
jgi:predicted GNAT family N-acyltransferase